MDLFFPIVTIAGVAFLVLALFSLAETTMTRLENIETLLKELKDDRTKEV